MRVKWPVVGAAFIGVFSVVSYLVVTKPSPDAGVAIGIAAVTSLVVLAVLVVGWIVRSRSSP